MLTLAALLLLAAEPRDPFAAYTDDVTECFTSPLTRTDVGALRVQGIVAGTASPRAMLALPDGTTHVVRVGTLVGRNLGQVASISVRGVEVIEEFRDAFGTRHPQRTLLKTR